MKSPQLGWQGSLAILCVLSIQAGLLVWARHFIPPRVATGVCTEPPTLTDLVFYVTHTCQTILQASKVNLWPGYREEGIFSLLSA